MITRNHGGHTASFDSYSNTDTGRLSSCFVREKRIRWSNETQSTSLKELEEQVADQQKQIHSLQFMGQLKDAQLRRFEQERQLNDKYHSLCFEMEKMCRSLSVCLPQKLCVIL